MENVRPEGTEDQYATSPSEEALGKNVHVKSSERIRNSSQRYNPEFGDAIEWNNDSVSSIVYTIQDRGLNSNVYTEDMLLLLADWDAEDCMDTPSTFHMRESYVLKSKIHDPDTLNYMEALSGEKPEKYFKAMVDEF